MIKGILFYFKNSDGNMYTKLFTLEGDEPINKTDFSLSTKFVSTNDVVDIAKKCFNSNVKSATALIDFPLLPKENVRVSDFQRKLISYSNPLFKTTRPDDKGEARCNITCKSDAKGYCVASESGTFGESWRCQSTECPKRATDYNPSSYLYDTETQNDSLYSFRDRYMANKAKGVKYINMYYSLSDSSDIIDSLDISFSIATLDIVENSILPIINELKSNPSSTSILYNNATRDNIVNYLLWAKNKFPSNSNKAKIDQIISDVNFLANKTNAEVDLYLSLP